MSYLAQFDSVDITAVPGLTVLGIDSYMPPRRSLTMVDIARTNKSKNTAGFYTERLITVMVGIGRNTRDLAEQSIDTLNGLIQGLEKDLIVSQAGNARKYTATLQDAHVVHGGGAYVELNLVFACTDRFGYDTAYVVIFSNNAVTSSGRSDNYTFGGSAPWQLPVLTYYYSALTGGTAKTVLVGNSATGQQVSITRTWVAGDRLEIDVKNGTVKVNGVEVAWSGALPEFAPGAGTITYSDNLTTRTVNMSGYYYRRYI